MLCFLRQIDLDHRLHRVGWPAYPEVLLEVASSSSTSEAELMQ